MAINVIINGAAGKMGSVAKTTIAEQPDLKLVACTDRQDDLAKTIKQTGADVVIDFTRPDCVFENTKTIITHHARPVVGTTGLTLDQIETLKSLCKQQSIGAIIAPNFSLGAILMMKYAKDAAKYLPDVEIIEMHHQQKLDAPSGTATKTAELMAEEISKIQKDKSPQNQARGKLHQGVSIHSIRLPGLFAHQAVIFGGLGEILTIRHDGMSREAMMPGLFLSCRKVMEIDHLIYGLEDLL